MPAKLLARSQFCELLLKTWVLQLLCDLALFLFTFPPTNSEWNGGLEVNLIILNPLFPEMAHSYSENKNSNCTKCKFTNPKMYKRKYALNFESRGKYSVDENQQQRMLVMSLSGT